jgi:hypothetical protein
VERVLDDDFDDHGAIQERETNKERLSSIIIGRIKKSELTFAGVTVSTSMPSAGRED